MLTLPSLFISSFLIALSGAMMPGPLLTATISESVKRGPVAGPLIMSGHLLLEGALVLALIAGVAPLLQKDLFFILVSFGGALILAWMAFGMFRSLPTLRIDWGSASGQTADRQNPSGSSTGPTGPAGPEKKSAASARALRTGVLLSIANPYWVVWWATIGLGLVARAQKVGLLGILIFFLGHQAADFAWYSIVSTAVGKGRRFFSDRIYRGIIAVSALVLIGFALYFGWSGVERIFHYPS
ncbi:MAG: LysE family transporter [Spirochaetota bacterium]